MQYLLDTNVVCEATARHPEASVLAWIDAHAHEYATIRSGAGDRTGARLDHNFVEDRFDQSSEIKPQIPNPAAMLPKKITESVKNHPNPAHR